MALTRKRIGEHKLYRGDCRKLLKKLKDESIEAIVSEASL